MRRCSVALAWRSTSFPFIWFVAGMAAAYAFGYAFGLNDTITLAVGCGLGAGAGTIAGDRKARNDKEVAGGTG
ncbi:MAG: hypothetical protein QNJ81_00795 [Acidimicrobiia bacterium]|nr:hypothetical protein [Acidimicrobiia bacterium]